MNSLYACICHSNNKEAMTVNCEVRFHLEWLNLSSPPQESQQVPKVLADTQKLHAAIDFGTTYCS